MLSVKKFGYQAIIDMTVVDARVKLELIRKEVGQVTNLVRKFQQEFHSETRKRKAENKRALQESPGDKDHEVETKQSAPRSRQDRSSRNMGKQQGHRDDNKRPRNGSYSRSESRRRY